MEFSNSVWSPYRVGLTEKIEKVQKRATKLAYSHVKVLHTQKDLESWAFLHLSIGDTEET